MLVCVSAARLPQVSEARADACDEALPDGLRAAEDPDEEADQ